MRRPENADVGIRNEMIYRPTVLIVILMLAYSVQAGDQPLLKYHWRGGYSPYTEVSVSILDSGEALVTAQKQTLPAIDYRTQLSPEEVGAVRTLIRSTEFLTQSEQDPGFATDMGESEMTVHMDGRRKTLTYCYRPSLDPLVEPIWKLVTQATAIQALETDGDIYSASGAIKPSHSGMKALQPSCLKIPLMSYARENDNRQKVQWALEALACITTPEEFSGFVSLALEQNKQRDKFLGIVGTHPFYGNIPNPHLKALCPIYLAFVRDAHSRLGQLNDTEKEAFSDFTRLLGESRYEPAIPLFKMWFEDHKEPYITTALTPLAKMGQTSLAALAPYLESQEESYKLNAIELVTITARLGPHGGFANPLSEYDYSRMLPLLTNTVIPRLVDLSTNEKSDKVQKKASNALEEIRILIQKEEDSNKALQAIGDKSPQPER